MAPDILTQWPLKPHGLLAATLHLPGQERLVGGGIHHVSDYN